MTTEQLDPQPSIDPTSASATASNLASDLKNMDMDKVSAAMGNYMLQGWTMLNDGCPDCNTPLMRNRESTSQICVNCELNPPVDNEEHEDSSSTQPESASAQPASQPPSTPAINTMSAPAPTTALPSIPGIPVPRPPSPQNHRASVLDPMMEARRALRPVAARNIGGSGPQPPSTPPPPRSSTPLPMPPSTPPPGVAKPVSGPLSSKGVPRPPGPPPSLPLSPPPSGALLPQPVARDMRRSPQSSIVISGNILPPSTPPPPPPAVSVPVVSAPVDLPEQSTSTTTPSEVEVEQDNEDKEVGLESAAEPSAEDSPEEKVDTMEGIEQHVDETVPVVEAEPQSNQTDVAEAIISGVEEAVQEEDISPAGDAPELTDTDDKGLESDDDFEDAEEEVFKPTAEEIKERESKREQSERASRLIGQMMLQGWAMLQDPCPNPSCHGVPLLRNREKKEYCVVCENYFQREQDLEFGKYTIVNNDSKAAVSAEISVSTLPPPPTTLPPPPQVASPPAPPQIPPPAASPIASPSRSRNQRDLQGKVSNSIILPPAAPMSPSLGMTSQQILGKHASEDFDKLASEDEEARRHIQIIRKVGEFSSRSLPPVPVSVSAATSRPASTYSNSSEYHPSENERPEKHSRHHHHQRSGYGHGHGASSIQPGQSHDAPAPPPAPLAPEVQALVSATHKTIATLLVKLEAYRQALEVSESPKECQVLTAQIKGLMECLSACRATL
ncbi:UPF0148 protein [Entomortierella parvispora]|uniref:UPF0148 protein n=1 Tax=Entomortierella parvispora TaxID=205924 RepID=A0A9P3HDV9_9FUNG|nr:UPF0148 protein [Entomortierella parvispora]